jgi:hypothetical protein
MGKQKENKKNENISSVYPYITKKPSSETIYAICTGTSVSFDIGKIINGQPRHP